MGADNHLVSGEIEGAEQSGEFSYDIVVCRVKFVEETGGTPPTSDDNQSFLCWIMGKLRPWSAFLISDIIETRTSDDHCAESEPADCLESSAPSRDPDLAKRVRRKWTREHWVWMKHTCGCSAGVEYLASWMGLGPRLARAWVAE